MKKTYLWMMKSEALNIWLLLLKYAVVWLSDRKRLYKPSTAKDQHITVASFCEKGKYRLAIPFRFRMLKHLQRLKNTRIT